MGKTAISWATHTWNPATGCSKPIETDPATGERFISPECKNCYAEALSLRRKWTTHHWTEPNAEANVRIHPDRLRAAFNFNLDAQQLAKAHPLYPIRVFVNSMSDLFHRLVPDEFIWQVFQVMNDPRNAGRVFQVLTKRPERAAEWPGPWGPNIWMGTTSGDARTKFRIDHLRRCAAQVRFISVEPLLSSMVPIDLTGIHQVIVGGESGPGFRPMEMQWARELRDACVEQGCAFYFKQSDSFRTEMRCYLVEKDGRCYEWRQMPHDLSAPVEVQPDNAAFHQKHFHILPSTAA
jgi:protein gp37